MDIKIYKFHNYSSMCYFNSAMQCLINNTGFIYFIHEYSGFSEILNEIKYILSDDKKIHDLRPLKEKMSRVNKSDIFSKDEQQDSQEALMEIIDVLAKEYPDTIKTRSISLYDNSIIKDDETKLKALKNFTDHDAKYSFSEISELFTGQFIHNKICKECKTKESTFSIFQNIFLDADSDNILDALRKYVKYEQMISEDKCKICDGNEYYKKTNICNPPNTLILIISRYIQVSKKIKIFDSISINIEDVLYFYKIKTVVYHTGTSIHGGHYYNTVNIQSDTKQPIKILINDDKVSVINNLYENSYIICYEYSHKIDQTKL